MGSDKNLLVKLIKFRLKEYDYFPVFLNRNIRDDFSLNLEFFGQKGTDQLLQQLLYEHDDRAVDSVID